MTPEQFALAAITLLISIIGYFLKGTMDKINSFSDKIAKHTTDIEVLKTNNSTLNARMDDLFTAIKELSVDIKDLTKQLSNKKDRKNDE